MNVADFLVKTLVEYDVTDVFGIPGGVVLDLIYALEKRGEISAHLSYHEQGAAFAAAGYAQVHGTLGAVYATRGPGFTNLITGIADAYQESIPILFITAHNQKDFTSKTRMDNDQELDTISIAKSITKYSVRIDKIENAATEIQYACKEALSDRKGPVLLDIAATLWNKEICETSLPLCAMQSSWFPHLFIEEISDALNSSKRPVILAGAGIQLSNTVASVQAFSKKHKIPILSSRCSQDLFAGSDTYFGYIGSHATRYSNFILSKSDLIISLGNRMSFPINSESFKPIFEGTKTIRVDIDQHELNRYIPNCKACQVDLKIFMDSIFNAPIRIFENEWLSICSTIKEALNNFDTEYPVDKISELMKNLPKDSTFVSDVGNNEFWVSRAYELSGVKNRILFSRAFGALGNSLSKAIGAYYKTQKGVVCFIGDQGLQMNIQELQAVADNSLPILIVLINNHSSGMIKSRQNQKYNSHFVHTTFDSGYGTPDFKKICSAYGIRYETSMKKPIIHEPTMYELIIDDNIDLQPFLPNRNPCQDMFPSMDERLYSEINNL